MKAHRSQIILLSTALLLFIGFIAFQLEGGSGAADSSSIADDGDSATKLSIASTQGSNGSALPDEFAILQTSNIFGGKGAGGPGGPATPESNFVFKGVMQAGNAWMAFIEDVNAKNVLQVAVGGSIARGQIKAIDLDSIQYESSGHKQQVEVGQNLDGQALRRPRPSAPAQGQPANANGQPQPPQPGQPGGPGGPRHGHHGGPPGQAGPPGQPDQAGPPPPDGAQPADEGLQH